MAKDQPYARAISVDYTPDGLPKGISIDPARLERGGLLGFADECHIEDAGDYLDLVLTDRSTKTVVGRWLISSESLVKT
jgi:hypothetical protein